MTQVPVFRSMTASDLESVLNWAAEEGWNPGLDDAEAFHATDQEGFFLAEVGGEPAAAISVVNHGSDLAFLGLYICRPEFRGKGIGYALWQHALPHAGSRPIGLDGVPDQQANYAKSGFEKAGETYRFVGVIEHRAAAQVRAARAEDLAGLIRLEARATGYDRRAFLGSWFADIERRKTVVLEAEGTIRGLATIRKCRNGFKIGPLVSDTQEEAQTLLHAAAEHAQGQPIMIDVPDVQRALSDYCESLGMVVPFNTARMYRGPAPRGSASMIHAVATLELG